MITIWPDEKNVDDYHYEFPPKQGELIHKLLGKISMKDYIEMGFTDNEIEIFNNIYYSF